jgi:hypothetical protein
VRHQAIPLEHIDISILEPVLAGRHDEVEIKASSLPRRLEALYTDAIVGKKSYHYYENFYRAESLNFFLEQSDCQRLAVVLLTVAMHGSCGLELALTNRHSELRSIRLPPPRSRLRDIGLRYVGKSFRYSPKAVRPLTSDASVEDKPVFRLTSHNTRVAPSDWEKRSVVELDISDFGLLLLVSMLLDLGVAATGAMELELAGLGGRAVGPGSAEARFWLPGSIGWNEF